VGALDRFEWERLVRELDLPVAVNCTAYAIATYANRDGTKAHPGRDNLSQATGLSQATVSAALAALEAGQLLNRKSHGGGRGVKLAAEYDLAVPKDGTTQAGTERTIRAVYEARTGRKTSWHPTSNGQKTSGKHRKEVVFAAKDLGSSAPTKPFTPSLPSPSFSAAAGGIQADVEGTAAHVASTPNLSTRAGTEQRRMELADALTAWEQEHAPGAAQ
jgi:hypothetical protein